MRAVLLTVALLGLAACGREETSVPVAPEAPAAPAAPAGPPVPPKPPEAPDRLAFVDAGGAERLTLACEGGQMQVTVPEFDRIGSEDRLTVGAGNEAFAFVADLQAPGEGIIAGGAPEADMLARLARGEPVSAIYGQQTVGPLRAARPASLPAFAALCADAPAG